MPRDRTMGFAVSGFEKEVIEEAAGHLDETPSTFVRRAALQRAVEVARPIPAETEPTASEKEPSHA